MMWNNGRQPIATTVADMSSTPEHDSDGLESDREELLAILKDAIHDVRDRTTSREIKTLEDERILIKWYRTLGTLTGQYRKLQKDTDIDEMQEELELLQNAPSREARERRR